MPETTCCDSKSDGLGFGFIIKGIASWQGKGVKWMVLQLQSLEGVPVTAILFFFLYRAEIR